MKRFNHARNGQLAKAKPMSKACTRRSWAVAAAVLGCLEACNGTDPAKVASDCDGNPSLPGCASSDTRCATLPKDEACLDRAFFREAVVPVFAKHCVECHVPGGLAWGSTQLSLAGEDAWDSLVNHPALEMAESMMRVRPGMPESSYLYLKISQAIPPVGSRMPLAAAPLAPSEIKQVRQWIMGRP